MLKINRRTDYAVRVLVALANCPPGERIPTQQIQAQMSIPRAYLQRIVAVLSQAALILAYPGPGGGLQLARSAQEITLKDIYTLMEGNLCLSDCLAAAHNCPLGATCPLRSRWECLQALILHELSKTTIAQLASEALGSRFLTLPEGQLAFKPHALVEA